MPHAETMTVEEAFGLFQTRAVARGVSDLMEEVQPESSGSRSTTARGRSGGALRLVWDGRDGTLMLEITHGPPDATPWWLDLFLVRGRGQVVPTEEQDIGFEDAVEYGLELLQPERGDGAA